MRLRKCLIGQAKEAVAYLLIHPQNVDAVMEELEFRFGRPDILVKAKLAEIQNLPSLSERNTEDFLKFSTALRNMVASLVSIILIILFS